MKTLLFFFFLLTSGSISAKNCIEYINESPVHITRVDLNCKNIELIGSDKSDNGTTVSEFAQKYRTAVAINANFFWKDFTPIGLVVNNGKRWSKYGDTRSRVLFACDKANKCFIEDKNRTTPLNTKWKTVIAGWHWFNPKTNKFECAANDKVGCVQSIFTDKHPRTFIGLNEAKNWLYLVVVEGRQFGFQGLTLDELATIAQKLELTKAVNLDGGGSSTMVINNKRANSLPLLQGSERKVSNHLGIRLKAE